MDNNLPELRDIHLPAGVLHFPIAYGWWVILACIIGTIVIYNLVAAIRRQSKKLYALKLLSSINTTEIIPSAVKISEILRRICVYKYPEASILFGKEWINFLNQHSKETIRNPDLLINAPYIKPDSQYGKSDIDELIKFAQSWIGENL